MTTKAEEREVWRQTMDTWHDVLICTDQIRQTAQQYRPEDRDEFFRQLHQSINVLEKDMQP